MLYLFDDRVHYSNRLSMRMRFWTVVPGNRSTSQGWSNDFRPGWLEDPVLKDRAIQTPGLLVSVPRVFGWAYYPPLVKGLRAYEPRESEYDSGADQRAYSNAVNGAFALGTAGYFSHAISGEGVVSHRNYAGTLGNAGVTDYLRQRYSAPNSAFGPLSLYRRATCDNRISVFKHLGFGDLRFLPQPGAASAMEWFHRGEEFCRELESSTTGGRSVVVERISGYSKTRYVYHNFHAFTDGQGIDKAQLRLTYSMYVEAYNLRVSSVYPVASHLYDVNAAWETKVVPRAYSTNLSPGNYDLGYKDCVGTRYSVRYYLLHQEGVVNSDCPWPTETTTVTNTDAYFGVGSSPAKAGVDSDWAPDFLFDRTAGPRDVSLEVSQRAKRFFNPGQDYTARVASFFVGNQFDLRSTAVMSAGDALTGSALTSNFLESLPELPQLVSALGPPVKATRALMAVLGGDVSKIPTLARELASTYLGWKYGIEPAKGDVKNLQSVLSGAAYKDLSGVGEFRGSFRYTFSKELHPWGDGELSLTSRSKVVIHGLSGLASILLATGQGGVSPTLSNLWDLVPFSFVVDWFTGISDRLRDIDNTILLLAVKPIYFVHSYTVEYRPSKSELVKGGFSIQSDPRYLYYVREISRYIPMPRDTHIDFRQGTFGKSQMMSAGALLLVTAPK